MPKTTNKKEQHKHAVDPKTGKLKPKYRDMARFPKVQTDGYEKEFGIIYGDLITNSVKEIKGIIKSD